jgi:hypothetical protein
MAIFNSYIYVKLPEGIGNSTIKWENHGKSMGKCNINGVFSLEHMEKKNGFRLNNGSFANKVGHLQKCGLYTAPPKKK